MTYRLFAALSLAIGLLDLFLLDRILTPGLARASLIGSVYCIASLPFLIIETFHLLDVSNVIGKISDDAARFARRNIKEQPPIMSQDPRDSRLLIPVSRQWRMIVEKWVLGSMPLEAAFPKFEVPHEVVSRLEEIVRPITSTCLKAIALDRREVVLACLRHLSYVTDTYVKARQSYEGGPDEFLLFINGQVEIAFNAALASPNQQYTADITECVATLAVSSLALSKPRGGGYPVNSQISIFSGLLEKIPIRSFHLEQSEAPMKACRSLAAIGVRLVQQQAYEPVVFTISRNLATIGRFCSARPGPWPALLSQATTSAFASLLQACIEQSLKTGDRYDGACRMLLEKLDSIMTVWYEKDHGHMDNQTVIAPLIGGLWQGPTIPWIFAAVLRTKIPDSAIVGALGDLQEIAREIGRLGRCAIANNRAPQYDYFVAFSEIGYEVIRFVAGESESEIAGELNNFLEATLSPAVSLVSESYKNSSYHASDDLLHVSPLWAFLMHYYLQSKKACFLEFYAETFKQLMTIDREAVALHGEDPHRLSRLYKYVKLFGAWFYRFARRHALNKEVILFLAENHAQQGLQRGFPARPEMDSLGYPTAHIGEGWFIQPSGHWPEEGRQVTRELNDLGSYKRYDRLVRRVARKMGTYVEMPSRAGIGRPRPS
jgi:hypothetical protein